jgi:o-succinylbenzoate synthase
VNVAGAEITRASAVLARSASNSARSWHERSGLLVRLHDAAGRTGYGEASPLPGYSPDGLGDCEAVLGRFAWSALQPAADFASVARLVAQQIPATLPAARFAAELAALDLLGQQTQAAAWRLLAAEPATAAPLGLATLLDAADAEGALVAADAAKQRGITTFKLKVGRCDAFERELSLLRKLRARFGHAVRLRLDANRAWSARRAAERLQALAEIEPEFVEEPVSARQLHELGSSPVPLALDESLQTESLEAAAPWLRSCRIEAVVLKPMALGGLAACLELAAGARRHGLAVVVSHLFDGPVALAGCAALALCAGSAGRAAGLDRHAGLGVWPSATIATLTEHAIVPSDAPGLGLRWAA